MKSSGRESLRGRFFGTAITGLIAALLVGHEWNLRRVREVGRAVVLENSTAYGRSGVKIADVIYRAGGGPIRASLRTWFHRLRAGQDVDILYRSGELWAVDLDEFWERHLGSVAALTVFALVAIGEARGFASRRRSAGLLLGDEPIGGPPASEVLRHLGVE